MGLAKTAFEDPDGYFNFLEASLTRRELQVFTMLEGHFRHLDPTPDPILVVESVDGEIAIEGSAGQLNDLERIGLLAKGLFGEIREQFFELDDEDDEDA